MVAKALIFNTWNYGRDTHGLLNLNHSLLYSIYMKVYHRFVDKQGSVIDLTELY